MVFGKMREIVEGFLGKKINNVVIIVFVYFNDV